jgi:hypothetical protein
LRGSLFRSLFCLFVFDAQTLSFLNYAGFSQMFRNCIVTLARRARAARFFPQYFLRFSVALLFFSSLYSVLKVLARPFPCPRVFFSRLSASL